MQEPTPSSLPKRSKRFSLNNLAPKSNPFQVNEKDLLKEEEKSDLVVKTSSTSSSKILGPKAIQAEMGLRARSKRSVLMMRL